MSLCTVCHIQLEAHSIVSAFNLLRINTHAYTQICKLQSYLWEATTLLNISLLLSLTICCAHQELHILSCATLSGVQSIFLLSHINPPPPPFPILPPPPSCFSPSSSPVILQEDRGGHLTLQKRWTSFLKTRLTCSLPEYDFHFNMLRSVFALPGQTPQDMLFYGIFGPEW